MTSQPHSWRTFKLPDPLHSFKPHRTAPSSLLIGRVIPLPLNRT